MFANDIVVRRFNLLPKKVAKPGGFYKMPRHPAKRSGLPGVTAYARIVLLSTTLLISGAAIAASQQAPAYYDIQPGTSSRAQVELRYGEPIRRVAPGALIYEYAPPADDVDSDRIVMTFESDTQHVARVDAYLKTYLPASLFREKLGTRIATRDRPDGGREEFYYPQFQALIFAATQPDAPVVAVSFVSPRTLADVFVRRFDNALARKSYEEARTEADKAVAIDPGGGAGYNAQGRLFAALGDAEEALVRFTAAANAAQGQYDRHLAHIGMAEVYAVLSKLPDKAKIEYLAAIDMAPQADRSNARLAYSRFLKAQGKEDEALAELRKAVDVDSAGNSEARYALAETYWEKGDYAKALPHYEVLSAIADTSPDDARKAQVYARYGLALRSNGKVNEAIAAYEKSLDADSKQIAVMNSLALIYMEAQNPTKAAELYREALEVSPNDHVINRDLIEALYHTGQIDEARRQAEFTLSLRPNDPATLFALARCHAALKNKKEAVTWVQRAVDAGFADRQALATDPAFDVVRDERAFKRLLAQLTQQVGQQ
jgi:tetratricopeptide (TPR) repeat protein